jgi:hypothetical protein
MLPTMLADNRRRVGWSVEQGRATSRRHPPPCRELEAGERSPDWETWDRINRMFGWPQTFAAGS